MSDPDRTTHPDRDETPAERADRNMMELLQELRVATTGVQVLFAFLLAVPFAQGFAEVTDFQKQTYFATLLLSCAAAAFLIAPAPYHRLNFAQRDKKNIVEASARLSIIGIALLAFAMTGAVMLITDVLFSSTTVTITVIGIALMFILLWFVMPLLRRAQNSS